MHIEKDYKRQVVQIMEKLNSFYKMLKNNAEKYPNKEAIIYDTMTISYSKLFEDVCKKALHLKRFTGNRIALYGPSSYRWIVNMFGIILAGKDVMLVDFFLPQNTRNGILKKVGVDYVLTSTNQYILADSNAIMIPDAEKDDVEGFVYDEDSAVEGNILMLTAVPQECDKAVVLTVSNIFNTINEINEFCLCEENDKVLAQIALHHIFGYIYSLIWPLHNGACVCIGRGLRHIDADTYYYNPTILPGSPSMIDYLKRIKAFNNDLRTVIIGGASCPFRLFEALSDRDLKVYNVYGMTETSGCIGINDTMDGTYKLFGETQVTIAADGEILVSGDCVMNGYDKDEAYTARVLKDGVYHTGDLGRINEKGRLVLLKRNPEIILLPTGEKISRTVTIREITALDGVSESYVTLYNDKLTALIVPIDKEARIDRFVRLINRYNERKGFRWEIQKVKLIKAPLPRLDNGDIDQDAVDDLMVDLTDVG
jgi:long-chain acyl-CoA synthetase